MLAGGRGRTGAALTNDELLTAYERHQRDSNHSGVTIENYRKVLNAVARDTAMPLLSLDGHQIEAWLRTRRAGVGTWVTYRACLASFYRWAVREELTDRDPTLRVVRPRQPQLLPRPISTPDLALALELADPSMRAMLCLGAYQGLRAHEIAKCAAEDLQMWLDPPMLRVVGKGRKERLLPVAHETEVALVAWGLPHRGPIFPSPLDQRRPLGPRTVTIRVAAYLRSVGIDATCHQLRHWFGSEVYARTTDLRLVQELMGHANPSTTALYAKVRPDAGAPIVRFLSATSTPEEVA